MKFSKKLFLMLFIGFVASNMFAASFKLKNEEIDPEALEAITSKDYDTYMYDDGDIRVRCDGINILVMWDQERSLIKFRTFWQATDKISDLRALKLVNEWNINKVFTTAYYDKTDDDGSYFVLEYFMTTLGGINSENYNDTLDWIFSIADSFGDYLNGEDAI